MNDTHNPHVLRTDPANGVIMEFGGKRFLTGGRAEIWVTVDGKPQWREARWDSEIVSELWSRRGVERTEAPVLRPVLREGERLVEAIDGRLFIEPTSAFVGVGAMSGKTVVAERLMRAAMVHPNGACPKCRAPHNHLRKST